MSMVRWEPYRELERMSRAMDRLFPSRLMRAWPSWLDLPEEERVSLDMYQTDNDVVVEASVPGVKPEELDVSISGDMLTIKGERKEEREVKEENYLRRERTFGSFERLVTLPVAVKMENITAEFENGVLTVTMPKAEEVKPKQIKIQPKEMPKAA